MRARAVRRVTLVVVCVESQAYATFRQPQQIMLARFAKIGFNIDF